MLLSDVDVVWLANPFALPSLHRDADVEAAHSIAYGRIVALPRMLCYAMLFHAMPVCAILSSLF